MASLGVSNYLACGNGSYNASELDNGYAQSKYVAENVLEAGSRQPRIPASILRIGQVAGGIEENAAPRPEKEWFPSLSKPPKSMKAFPSDLPDVDWIPINFLTKIVVEIVLHDTGVADNSNKPMEYNLVNPKAASLESVAGTAREYFASSGMKAVSLIEWIKLLEATSAESVDVVGRPSLKILPFFQDIAPRLGGLRKVDTSAAVEVSSTMAALAPVKSEWIGHWLERLGC